MPTGVIWQPEGIHLPARQPLINSLINYSLKIFHFSCLEIKNQTFHFKYLMPDGTAFVAELAYFALFLEKPKPA